MAESDRYRVLIIEDEALVARELKSRLTAMGYEVAGVAYGAEGADLARETKPDLMLTDIHLKNGEDGIDVALEVIQDLDIPVVFLTAYSDDETVARAKAVTPYGYIIKPVENRELQIVIEMALYKHNIEKELRKTQELLQIALKSIGSSLIFVDREGVVFDINEDAQRLLQTGRAQGDAVGRPWHSLFNLDPGSSVGARVARAFDDSDVTKLAPFVIQSLDGMRLVDGIVGPTDKGAVMIVRELSDIGGGLEPAVPVLDQERLTPSESSLCQLLVAIDRAEPADVAAAAVLMNERLRSTDLVSPHGENELAVSMPYTDVEEARQIATSLLAALRESQPDTVFSMGLAYTLPSEQQPFELFRRAAWALEISRDSGGNRVVLWSDEADSRRPAMSEDKERGYHNVVLLWNVMNLVVNSTDRESLALRVCEHVLSSFDFERVAVLEKRGDAVFSLAGVTKGGQVLEGVADLGLDEEDFRALRELGGTREMVFKKPGKFLFQVAPDIFVDVRTNAELGSADEDFLYTLVSYAGGGLSAPVVDVEGEPASSEREIIYQSSRMQSIMDSVQLVAPTDATVLIIGESGTGKESIARAIHDASPRADKPFTIVDCGAVVGSLIESELFGHVKGAFTGADRDFSGRLKEADGGTVLLDEVGELPLDVQVKLLRFVQEQQIAPVGSNKYESVDTRIVAATNRDLESLVAAGEFREDLFYRLNVFSIQTPPLREREGDLLVLARHFLQKFADQYGKQITGFTPEAEASLMEQRWPGNIRELMNVINRAVILCRGDQVSNIHLGLFPDGEDSEGTPKAPASSGSVLERWAEDWISRVIDLPDPPPLAQWLEEDLIVSVMNRNGDVLNRAAQALRIPESTLRRKVTRLRAEPRAGSRPDASQTVAPVIKELMSMAANGESILDALSRLLMNAVEARNPGRREAAAIMGVSLPTYRKMLSESP